MNAARPGRRPPCRTSWRRGRLAAVPFAFQVLAACQPAIPEFPRVPRGVVDIDHGAAAFRDICLDTAPGFDAARDRYAVHGLTRPGAEGLFYDESGTLSVRVDTLDTPAGPQLRCSIVYEDPNPYIARERIDMMLAEFAGRMTGERTARFPTVEGGLREGRAWIFTVDGRPGELLDVPHAGGGNLGVLIIQFPVG